MLSPTGDDTIIPRGSPARGRLAKLAGLVKIDERSAELDEAPVSTRRSIHRDSLSGLPDISISPTHSPGPTPSTKALGPTPISVCSHKAATPLSSCSSIRFRRLETMGLLSPLKLTLKQAADDDDDDDARGPSPEDAVPKVFPAPRVYPPGLASCSYARHPTVMAKIHLFEKLGEGSSALVRRGIRIEDGRAVAVKVIRTDDEEMVALEQAEFEMMAKLKHPNIVETIEFLDFTEAVGRVFIVMELIDGKELDEFVTKHEGGRLPQETAAQLGCDLLGAVGYLHSMSVIHRDLKPANVIVDSTGGRPLAKIVDFNAAAMSNQGDKYTCAGTFLFRAPELLTAWGHGPKTDVWGVGQCLFFMLRGQPMHSLAGKQTANYGEWVSRYDHKYEEDDAFRNVSPAAFVILRKALARQARERPFAEDILPECQAWLASL